MNSLNFTTIFHDNISNVNLYKPEVQIPYFIKKVYNLNVVFCYVKKKKTVYRWSTDVISNFEWIKLNQFKNLCIFYINLHIIYFLIVNSKKIDILHMLHFKPSIIYWILYKLLNKNWKLYITLDFNSKVDKSWFVMPTNFINTFIYKIISIYCIKLDFVSLENKEWIDLFTNYMPILRDKIIYMPFWYNKDFINKFIDNVITDKEKIILNVCRIWTKQKNTEMILKALDWIDILDWKFYLVWPIEESFKQNIDDFFITNPWLINKVIFTWPIYDKWKLYDFFNRTKVFCLSSIMEWASPNVLSEALYFWNYLLLTDFSWAIDVTNNQNVWKIIWINDYVSLRVELMRLINWNTSFPDINKIRNFAENNYNREILIKRIWDKLNLTNV